MNRTIHIALALCCSVITTHSPSAAIYSMDPTIEAGACSTDIEQTKQRTLPAVEYVDLSFEYLISPSRPVSEFNALVTLLESGNSTVTVQKCTERRKYEPGNYRIEINTFPTDVRYVDLDHGEKVIIISQPGFANFPVNAGVDYITIYEQKGGEYIVVQKFSMEDPVLQHLQMQPGRYQAHFHNTDRGAANVENIVNFRIKSNEEQVVKWYGLRRI